MVLCDCGGAAIVGTFVADEVDSFCEGNLMTPIELRAYKAAVMIQSFLASPTPLHIKKAMKAAWQIMHDIEGENKGSREFLVKGSMTGRYEPPPAAKTSTQSIPHSEEHYMEMAETMPTGPTLTTVTVFEANGKSTVYDGEEIEPISGLKWKDLVIPGGLKG